MTSEVDQLKSALQDAYLVAGEQAVALRRYQLIVEQLQTQLAAQEPAEVAEDD